MNIEQVEATIQYYDETISNDIISVKSTTGSTFNTNISQVDKIFNINWTSAEVSDSSRNIDTFIEISFTKTHNIAGFTLSGNISVNDIEIIAYLDNESISSSSSSSAYSVTKIWAPSSDFNKIRINVLSTENTNQKAIIENIAFYLKKTETSANSLYNVSASKSFDITAESNSDGECQFSFKNFFSIPFGNSEIFAVNDTLKQNQNVELYTKFVNDSDYSTFGIYKTKEIYGEDADNTIVVNAVDTLVNLSETYFKKGKIYSSGRSLYDWAQDVLDDAGVDGVIDENLKNFISYGYITEVPHREALRLIAEVSGGVLYVDNNGKINIKILQSTGLKNIDANTDIVEDSLNIENKDKIQGINVSYFSYVLQEFPCELGYIESMVLTDTPQKVDITYAQFPVDTDSVSVYIRDSIAEISDINIYAEHIELSIKAKKGFSGSRTYITVIGKPYDTVIHNIKTSELTYNVKTINTNYLITDSAMAQNIADYQAKFLVNNYTYNFEIANPNIKLGLGDMVYLKRVVRADIKYNKLIITGINANISYGEEYVNYSGVEVYD